jgi:L-lysine 6-transaminase
MIATRAPAAPTTPPDQVHSVLRTKQLVDGFPVVYDPDRSHDAWLVDARDGTEYLDLFSFFASLPLGHNHPGLAVPAFREKLLRAALSKPTCSDLYTQAQADFVAAFSRTLPPAFTHLFFIEGGALAVENALKAAFDWKIRKNLAQGRGERGTQVLHFRNAFHGRSGYTLSLTNTFDPRKTMHFPKFPWPRVEHPTRRFPEGPAELVEVAGRERNCLARIESVLEANPHDVAAIIIETIQAEGGDNHVRPEFLAALRRIADEQELLLIFDEIQSGFGLTGRWWAFEHHGTTPDIFCFGKKAQVCGIAATARLDEVDSVFKIPSRINSTFGGNLTDMVRCQRYIEIIEAEDLLSNAEATGKLLLDGLRELSTRHQALSNARGLGLMCAFDLPDTATRDRLRKILFEEQRTIILPCGERSLRCRPVLDFTAAHVEAAISRLDTALRSFS